MEDSQKPLISEAIENGRAQRYLSVTAGGKSLRYSVEIRISDVALVERSKSAFESDVSEERMEGFEPSITPRQKSYTQGFAERVVLSIRGYASEPFAKPKSPNYRDLRDLANSGTTYIIRDLAKYLRTDVKTVRAELGEEIKGQLKVWLRVGKSETRAMGPARSTMRNAA